MAPRKAGEEKTTDELIQEIVDSGIDPEELQRRMRAAKVQKTRDHFTRFLKDDAGVDGIKLTVKDWRAVREFIKEPPTAEANPGGQIHADILLDTADAIENKDEVRFLHNLLLIYKAIRRA